MNKNSYMEECAMKNSEFKNILRIKGAEKETDNLKEIGEIISKHAENIYRQLAREANFDESTMLNRRRIQIKAKQASGEMANRLLKFTLDRYKINLNFSGSVKDDDLEISCDIKYEELSNSGQGFYRMDASDIRGSLTWGSANNNLWTGRIEDPDSIVEAINNSTERVNITADTIQADTITAGRIDVDQIARHRAGLNHTSPNAIRFDTARQDADDARQAMETDVERGRITFNDVEMDWTGGNNIWTQGNMHTTTLQQPIPVARVGEANE